MPEEVSANLENENEADLPVLRSKFASDMGGRSSHRLSKAFDRLGSAFGEAASNNENSPVSDPEGRANLPTLSNRKNNLGRGGWTAIGVLLVFLPLFVALLFWVFSISDQLQGYKYTLEQVQKGSSSNERETGLVNILNSQKLATYPLKTTDPVPVGSIKLYVGDYKTWAFTYSGLLPTDQNNVYVMWVVHLPQNGAQATTKDYQYLTSFVSQAGGRYQVIPESNFPPNFAYDNYTQLLVTEEPGAKGKPTAPTGPIRFVLDLSQVKLY